LSAPDEGVSERRRDQEARRDPPPAGEQRRGHGNRGDQRVGLAQGDEQAEQRATGEIGLPAGEQPVEAAGGRRRAFERREREDQSRQRERELQRFGHPPDDERQRHAGSDEGQDRVARLPGIAQPREPARGEQAGRRQDEQVEGDRPPLSGQGDERRREQRIEHRLRIVHAARCPLQDDRHRSAGMALGPLAVGELEAQVEVPGERARHGHERPFVAAQRARVGTQDEQDREQHRGSASEPGDRRTGWRTGRREAHRRNAIPGPPQPPRRAGPRPGCG